MSTMLVEMEPISMPRYNGVGPSSGRQTLLVIESGSLSSVGPVEAASLEDEANGIDTMIEQAREFLKAGTRNKSEAVLNQPHS